MGIRRLLFISKWFFIFFMVVFMNVAWAETKTQGVGRFVGGPCSYKSYPGSAELVSVNRVDAINEDAKKNGEEYDVRFVFHPETAPEESYARVAGKTHPFLLTNGSRPKMGFLKKYGIAVGKTLPCELAVMVKGTCTPILFKFPTVDLTDYEANQ